MKPLEGEGEVRLYLLKYDGIAYYPILLDQITKKIVQNDFFIAFLLTLLRVSVFYYSCLIGS